LNSRQHLRIVVDGQDHWLAHGGPGFVGRRRSYRRALPTVCESFATLRTDWEEGR